MFWREGGGGILEAGCSFFFFAAIMVGACTSLCEVGDYSNNTVYEETHLDYLPTLKLLVLKWNVSEENDSVLFNQRNYYEIQKLVYHLNLEITSYSSTGSETYSKRALAFYCATRNTTKYRSWNLGNKNFLLI